MARTECEYSVQRSDITPSSAETEEVRITIRSQASVFRLGLAKLPFIYGKVSVEPT